MLRFTLIRDKYHSTLLKLSFDVYFVCVTFLNAAVLLERCLKIIFKKQDMFPVWFFIVLIFIICYLLYITRPSEETLIVMSKNRIRKMQFWLKNLNRQ